MEGGEVGVIEADVEMGSEGSIGRGGGGEVEGKSPCIHEASR